MDVKGNIHALANPDDWEGMAEMGSAQELEEAQHAYRRGPKDHGNEARRAAKTKDRNQRRNKLARKARKKNRGQ